MTHYKRHKSSRECNVRTTHKNNSNNDSNRMCHQARTSNTTNKRLIVAQGHTQHVHPDELYTATLAAVTLRVQQCLAQSDNARSTCQTVPAHSTST
eukprot:3316838-Amphidinium_carterae.3